MSNYSEKINKQYMEQKKRVEIFNRRKTEEEKNKIKPVVKNFLGTKGVSKKEYNELIKYYLGTELMSFLKYDKYICYEYSHMTEKEKRLHDLIVRSCIVYHY